MSKQKQKKFVFFQKLPKLTISTYKKLKFILRFAIITIIAGILGITIILKNTDPNIYKKDISTSIEKLTGKKVEIKGNLKWKLFSFEPGINIENITISNEKWAKSPYLLKADNIIATISLKHMLTRKMSIDTLFLNNPEIYLEISKKGQNNWTFTKDSNTPKQTTQINNQEQTQTEISKFEFGIKNIKIKNAEIFYENQKTKIKETLTLNNLFINSNGYNNPILSDISITYKNNIYNANLKTTSLQNLLDTPNEIPLTGIIDFNGVEFKFAGKINNITKETPSLSATISLSAPDLQQSLKTFTNLPKFAPFDGDIEIIATPTFISLKKIKLNYLTAHLTGTSEITLQKNKKPNIKANLSIPFFDIPNLFYPNWEKAYFDRLATGKPRPKSPKKIIENPKAFRNIPLPVKELDLANINLKLNIGKLKAMPEMPIENIELNAILNDGNGIIAPLSLDYMDGKLKLNIIANNKNNTFNGDVSIKGEDINLGYLIDSTGYKKFFSGGDSNIDIVLSGHGPNLEIFMKHLNGYIKAYTTTKTIGYKIENTLMATDLISSIFKFIGKDIIGTITQQKKEKEQTEIECMVVNLNIKDGKTISNRGIAMQTKIANIIIDGFANIGDEYVDVSIITVVKEGFRMSNTLAEMIKIEGPMAEPNIIINKDGVINNVAKTAFTTAIVGTLTGGITLITTGLGLLTKSWLENIQSDKNPCQTAFKGNQKEIQTDDYKNQIIIKEKLSQDIKDTKHQLNAITTNKIEAEKEKIKSNQN